MASVVLLVSLQNHTQMQKRQTVLPGASPFGGFMGAPSSTLPFFELKPGLAKVALGIQVGAGFSEDTLLVEGKPKRKLKEDTPNSCFGFVNCNLPN